MDITDTTAAGVRKATDLLMFYFRQATEGGPLGRDAESEVREAVEVIIDTAVRGVAATIAPTVAEIGDDIGAIRRRLGSLESQANGMGY
jgi:hypothetical protein